MDFSGISNLGWVVIMILGIAVIGTVIAVSLILRNRNVKTKFFEISHEEHEATKKEIAMAEGKDQLDNQCQVAKQILKELRMRLYETGVSTFKFQDEKDLNILELITYRIIDRMNYDIKNDLTRNHITKKTTIELEQYTRAKARGYFSMMQDRLYVYNRYLPEQNLPEIMERIPRTDVETILKDVYFSARRITGGLLAESFQAHGV